MADSASKAFTWLQFELFMEVVRKLQSGGISIPLKHVANSAATLDLPEMALDMVRSGDWVTPRLNDMPFMDKPPLVYWIQAVLTRMFGSSEMVARAPTLLAGCFWVLFVFLFAYILLDELAFP